MDTKKIVVVGVVIIGVSLGLPFATKVVFFPRITLEQYDRIQPSMTYDEVVDILGREGKLLSTNTTSGTTVEVPMSEQEQTNNFQEQMNRQLSAISSGQQKTLKVYWDTTRTEYRPPITRQTYGWFDNKFTENCVLEVNFRDGRVTSARNIRVR